MSNNPIIWADFPDPDVIRVDDTYYMVSTTMHLMPGAVILRSYDLIHWEIVSYVYDKLDDTPGQRLQGDECIYGKGMWAASLRFHKGSFYVCFAAKDTHKTYLYMAKNIKGPWKKQYIEGFYHDNSLLFDDDGKVYLAYGNTEIHLTELNSELTAPKLGGLNRILLKDMENVCLGYEGSHIYKINGRYYIFFIHWPKDGTQRRVQACFSADSLEGEFTGGNVLDDDMDYHNAGVAQGGIVDTPDGEWFAFLFQDHGAVGRIPVLVPVHWNNNFPVFGIDGKVPHQVEVKGTHQEHRYEPFVDSDDFSYQPDEKGSVHLKKVWQWNHTPEDNLWSVTEKPGILQLRSGKRCRNVEQAVNTLTQRMMGPACEAVVTLDGSQLQCGDYAGICAFQGCYGLIALTKEAGQYYLVMLAREAQDGKPFGAYDKEPEKEFARIPVNSGKVTLKLHADFEDNKDEAQFYYQSGDEWMKLGITHKLYFKLDHFVGCRVGLFLYSMKETGGTADFSNFKYNCIE